MLAGRTTLATSPIRTTPRRRIHTSRIGVICAAADDTVHILVNSCTGKMGHATAESVVARQEKYGNVKLVPYTFCGKSRGVAVGKIGVSGVPVERVTPEERQSALDMIKATYSNLVVIDYTLPMAVNGNAAFYCSNDVPFVMGTTGGDRVALVEDTKRAGCYAVIAPNMGKQIVAFQSMMEMMAEQFPGCFEGYTLEVRESHQRTKVDTSGTAKAVVQSFQAMGLADFKEEDITKIRKVDDQLAFGVPAEVIDSGHAYHTYSLTSGDGTVRLEFKHNVNGRKVYAEGTVDAAVFLAGVVGRGRNGDGGDKRVFDMVDVLKAGAMVLFGLGVPELAVIAGVVALIYGPSKLPELGKGLGKTAKSFQTAAKEFEKELKEELKDDDEAGASKSAGSGSSKDE